MKRILLVRNDRMGDLLMSLPAVRQIRAAFPDAKVTLLIHRELKPLLEGHRDIDEFLLWDPALGAGWRAMLLWARTLRREQFDCAVVLNPTKLFHGAAWLAGIPLRAGYKRKWGFLLNRSIPDTKHSRQGHEADYNLELLPLLGVRPSGPVLKLAVSAEKEREAARLLESLGLSVASRPVAVHPWTSNRVKSWPMDSFRDLVRLLNRDGIPVIVIGGEENLQGMSRWKEGLAAFDLVGQVPLGLLPALLKQCRALVSNDSGPVHVAAAVGTPAVVVAPRSHAPVLKRWKPLGEPHKILISPNAVEVMEVVRERSLR